MLHKNAEMKQTNNNGNEDIETSLCKWERETDFGGEKQKKNKLLATQQMIIFIRTIMAEKSIIFLNYISNKP